MREMEREVLAEPILQRRPSEEPSSIKELSIEGLLAEGNRILIKPRGYSMYPLFVPGRDEALITPVEAKALKRGDVVLYRREGSILVLHRIWKRREDAFYLVGDNQKEVEGPLRPEQIKGVLTEIVRKGRRFSVRHPVYRVLSGIWLALRPLRPMLSHAAAAGKRLFFKRKSGGGIRDGNPK